MAGSGKKWLIGCGAGCGVLFLLVVLGGPVAFLGVRKAVDKGEDIKAGFEELCAQYGRPGDFTPAPDGSLSADRMDVFLAVRQVMAPDRKKMGDILRTLDDQEVDGVKPNWLGKTRAGFRLIPTTMDFLNRRNAVLLEQGMGLGEYLYIYSLAYFGLLDKDIIDGPSFEITGDSSEQESKKFRWEVKAGKGDPERDRERVVRTYLHRIHLQIARNQLAALNREGDPGGIRPQLTAEIAALEAEPLRLLWETGLPEVVSSSLEPYREQLEEVYDPMVNLLEIGLVKQE